MRGQMSGSAVTTVALVTLFAGACGEGLETNGQGMETSFFGVDGKGKPTQIVRYLGPAERHALIEEKRELQRRYEAGLSASLVGEGVEPVTGVCVATDLWLYDLPFRTPNAWMACVRGSAIDTLPLYPNTRLNRSWGATVMAGWAGDRRSTFYRNHPPIIAVQDLSPFMLATVPPPIDFVFNHAP